MMEKGHEFGGSADLVSTLGHPLACQVTLNKSSGSSGSQSYTSVQWGHSAPPIGLSRKWDMVTYAAAGHGCYLSHPHPWGS